MANAPSDNGTEDKPEYVTKDDIAQIVNQVVSSHLKRSLGKTIGEAVESAMAPIREQLGSAARIEDPSKPNTPSPESIELKKLQDKFDKSEKARKASEQRAHEERAYNALTSELTATGRVRPDAINVVADLLRARQVLRVAEDGTARYHLNDDEHFDLKEGVTSHFLKSKEASMFLAAPGSNPTPKGNVQAPFLPGPKPGVTPQQGPTGNPLQRAEARLAEMGVDIRSALG
jgi:hypothetical protein